MSSTSRPSSSSGASEATAERPAPGCRRCCRPTPRSRPASGRSRQRVDGRADVAGDLVGVQAEVPLDGQRGEPVERGGPHRGDSGDAADRLLAAARRPRRPRSPARRRVGRGHGPRSAPGWTAAAPAQRQGGQHAEDDHRDATRPTISRLARLSRVSWVIPCSFPSKTRACLLLGRQKGSAPLPRHRRPKTSRDRQERPVTALSRRSRWPRLGLGQPLAIGGRGLGGLAERRECPRGPRPWRPSARAR